MKGIPETINETWREFSHKGYAGVLCTALNIFCLLKPFQNKNLWGWPKVNILWKNQNEHFGQHKRKEKQWNVKKKKPWTKRRKQTMNPYYKLKSKVMTTDASNFRSYLATKMLLPYWPHDIAYSWSRKWQPIPACLPGKSHGQRSLAGYSPWGLKASDMTSVTEHTHKHTQGRWQEGLIYLTIQ